MAALFLSLIGEVTGVCHQKNSDGLPWGGQRGTFSRIGQVNEVVLVPSENY